MTIRLRKDEKEAVIAAEEWRPIHDFPGYEVSNLGRVRSWRWNRWKPVADVPLVMKVLTGTNDYPYVRLRIGDSYRNRSIHILVAEAFIGPRPSGLQVRHLDGIRENCRSSNLEYGTRADNAADKVGHGTHRRGERNPMVKLSEVQVADILAARAARETCTSIARRYGVSHQCISDIINGRRWNRGDQAAS